ncbi:aromatic ring-hydroxylating dioxygenase subunit alpha [uncultured Jatrophihabitans sp.]|uniref:aromatic ring-hydroxylating oxygenase subunit alpha n=1 Tax=uncultured Jatrophihabitans sp. TaxID=1610747 RepID=UPI0035CBAC6C
MSEAVSPPVATPGWTLPATYYLDQHVFEAELATVFRDGWLFAGHSYELAGAGDYLLFTLGDEEVIIVRDEDGLLRAHHNVCRHRGSRICAEPRGTVRALVCPYHQWTYGLDGRLRAARLMGDDFAKNEQRLTPAAVREVAGLVFISLADEPPDFAAAATAFGAQLAPHRLEHTRIVHRASYRVNANWKTLVENNRECYHCRGNHPEFLESNFEYGSHGDLRRSSTYDSLLATAYERWTADGLAPDDVSFPDGQWFRVARLPLRDGFRTESLDGAPVAPPLGEVGDDPGSLRLIGLPTLWAHANLDYAVTTRLTPIGPSVTDVEVCFLVAANAADDDVDLDRLTAVWTVTSEQDWQLCEANYAGIRSRAYRPGPLSPVAEASVQHFLECYLAALG